MKRIGIIILPALIAFFIFDACKNEKKSSLITGHLTNANKIWIYLQQITEKGDSTIDSVQTKSDGTFSIINPATSPEFFILRSSSTQVIFLALQEGEIININGDAKKFELTYTIKGSKDSELIRELRAHDRNLSDSLNNAYVSMRDKDPSNTDSTGQKLQALYTSSMQTFATDFIENNLSSIVSLSATKFLNQQTQLDLMNELRDSLVSAYPNNRYVSDYVSLVAEINKLPAGTHVPDITLKTPDGKSLSLSTYKGKIVLIDFWASWCGPCRAENPNLVKMYDRLKGQNFEIFGVSLDENVAAWKTAIAKDGITWPQVSELKRWDSKVVQDFHIEAIPYSVLIDGQGNILAKGLQATELEMRINEALRKNS